MEARFDMAREVEVALVLVAFTVTKLVMVEVALLTRIPPVKVRRVDVAAAGNGYAQVSMLESTIALVTVTQFPAPKALMPLTTWLVQLALPP